MENLEILEVLLDNQQACCRERQSNQDRCGRFDLRGKERHLYRSECNEIDQVHCKILFTICGVYDFGNNTILQQHYKPSP